MNTTQSAKALAHVTGLAFACETAGISDPAELAPMASFARTSEIYFAALSQYRRLKQAHGRFAATHDEDDPAHGQHQDSLGRARAALNAAEVAYKRTLVAWRESRGESAETGS
jgi:hypothetical protein